MNDPHLEMKPGFMVNHCTGFSLFIMTIFIAVLAMVGLTHSFGPKRLVQDTFEQARTADQIMAHAMIKGYSRAEELGSVGCPDKDHNGVADSCINSTINSAPYVSGFVPTRVRVGSGQLSLAPGTGFNRPDTPDLRLDARTSAGIDNTTISLLEQPLMALSLTSKAVTPFTTPQSSGGNQTDATVRLERVVSRQELTSNSQLRLKSTFLTHLHQSATFAATQVTADWAFHETQHLIHEPDSSGTRFKPVNSGCQCNCTKSRCKCACLQPSVWESRGSCQTASDGGVCQTMNLPGIGAGTRCTANAGRYCYLEDETWLATHWAVSLYTPRATEGRSCRPERGDSCPLTSKTGTTCSCVFDWPKPIDNERLSRLRLDFSNNKPSARLFP